LTLKMIPANITFSKPLYNRKATNRIVVHHSVSDPMTSAETIHQWHLDKGWSGIGYHYVIRSDGSIQTGRGIDYQGAHTYNYNDDGIGICLSGNFMYSPPTELQLQSLVELVRYIKDVYKKELLLQRHRDLNPTACPGDLFPWDNLLQRLQTVEPDASLIQRALDNHLITQVHDLTEVANKEFVLLTELNLLEEMRRNK
jgi:N-acetylmuramoyl-L-alanine amidase